MHVHVQQLAQVYGVRLLSHDVNFNSHVCLLHARDASCNAGVFSYGYFYFWVVLSVIWCALCQ